MFPKSKLMLLFDKTTGLPLVLSIEVPLAPMTSVPEPMAVALLIFNAPPLSVVLPV